MDRETITVLVVVGAALVGLLGAAFLVGSIYHSQKKRRAWRKAKEIAEYCQKVLGDIEPRLCKQTEFLFGIEVKETGRFPWQKEVFIKIEVRPPKSPRLDAIKAPVLECVHKQLNLRTNRSLSAFVDFKPEETSSEE